MVFTRVVAACALAAALVVAPVAGLGAPVAVRSVAHFQAGSPAGIATPDTRLLVISVDGLNPTALRRLGRGGTPSLHRLMAEGAFTLNARTQVEQTLTLPNHTSMVTGRRIDRAHEGHGVTWNTDRRRTTVQQAAGHGVASIFSVLHKAGMNVALFAAKAKFSLFDRSWPGIDRVTIKDERDGALTRAVRSDLSERSRDLTFLHLGNVDKTGHDRGFMSEAYLDAVGRVDRRLGSILATIDRDEGLDDLTIVLTSDHGGKGASHRDPTSRANYRVPFLVWGPGVVPGDLYDLNPAFQDPGRRRVGFAGEQPIRNGDVANLSADLLGLGPVPNSLWNADQALRAAP